MKTARTRLVVDRLHDGQRIDIFLAAASSLSRRAARRLLTDGGVARNGEPLRVQSRVLSVGDVIDLSITCDELGVPETPELPTLNVLFRDREFLVVEKPAGVLSQPSEERAAGDPALDWMVLASEAVASGRRPFLRMVHRLDRLTSGAVLFVRHPEVLAPLTRLWSDGSVHRSYLAIVEGVPEFDDVVVDEPIARDRDHRWRFKCHHKGKPARSEISVVARLDEDLAVVRCALVTGRTHQVRVHLAATGFPVLGDRLYGSLRSNEAPRPMLHARSIALPHPVTGEPLHIACPIPKDMAERGVTEEM